MSELAERGHFPETEQPESLGERRATFECADDEGASKPLARTGTEGQIEIASAARRHLAEAFQFGGISIVKARRIQPCITHAAKDDERAHLEAAREPIHLGAKVGTTVVLACEQIERDE